MDDLISRQEEIDVMKSISDSICEQQAIDALCELPSAQPETHEERTETHACDCISRKAAIEAVGSMLRRKFGIGGDLAEITLAELPSAQPEIVRCKECVYGSKDDYTHCPYVEWWNGKNDFCSKGKRRSDE